MNRLVSGVQRVFSERQPKGSKEEIMRKSAGLLAVAVLLVVASSSAIASVQTLNPDVLMGGSWGWNLLEDGYFGGQRYNIDQLVITEIGGSQFEPLTFRNLTNGWSDTYDTGGVAVASGSDLTSGNLYFQVWFLGEYDPNTSVHYFALRDGNVVGSGVASGNFKYTPDSYPQQPPDITPEPASVVVWCVLGMGSWLALRGWRRKQAQ
jgi:hypothetical protein